MRTGELKINHSIILHIEDNLDDATFTSRALQELILDHSIVVIKNGAYALDYIFAQGQYTKPNTEKQLSLIILDLKLPKIDGFEVLRQIKTNETTRSIPVVVFTSSKEQRDIKRCYDLGANSYIVKPMDGDQFAGTVKALGRYWLRTNISNK